MKTISNTGFWESENEIYHVCCTGLCNWIINYLNNQNNKLIHDFGCGLGRYLKPLNDAGFTNLIGYEGKIPAVKKFNNIIEQDLTLPFDVLNKGNVLCLEVGEHIPKKYEEIFINNITNACDDNLIMSWAIVGQDGDGHVNCLNNDVVISKIESKGFKFLPEETASARSTIGNDYWWFKNTTLIFKKTC